MKYDAAIIETFARGLYRRASRIVLRYALSFALAGFGISQIVYYFLPGRVAANLGWYIVAAITAIFTLIGAAVGNEKAFNLRLQAQLVLCQVQIERNTRASAELASATMKIQKFSMEATHLEPAALAADSRAAQGSPR